MLKTFFSFLLVFLFLFNLLAEAQNSSLKWGKITKTELELTICPFEPDASAVVLNNEGQISIGTRSVVITHHRRIKILNKNGLDQANIEIPYYINNDLENVKSVKAQTIKIDDKGKIEKIKVDQKKIYDVDLHENWKAKRFTFPDVKVGSIIEYTYITYSKNFTFLDGWMFQNEIPTLRSKCSALIPEYMDYRILLEGNRILKKYGGKPPVNGWELTNIPSIKDEPFVANYLDFAEKIRFQLAGYRSVNNQYQAGPKYVNTMTSWEDMAKERLTDINYNGYLNKSGKAKDILSTIIDSKIPSMENIEKIYNYVKDNFKWNGEKRIFTKQLFNEFLKSKTGNNVEVNLFLTLLLKNAGYTANPVLQSTRSHGKVSKSYPFISQFNYLICNVNFKNQDLLMDATNPNRPMMMLEKSSLNGDGYLLDKSNPRWVTIKPKVNTSETTYIKGTFDENGHLIYNVHIKYFGYRALHRRQESDTSNILTNLEQHMSIDQYSIDEVEWINIPEIDKPLEMSVNITTEDPVLGDNDIVYFQAAVLNSYQSNPFKSENRYFPVDYSYPFKDNYVLVLTLPEGYEIEESPENKIISLPDDFGSFRYLSNVTPNQYQLSFSFSIKKPSIPNRHYLGLKEFYNIMVAKLSETVVIKKVN